MTQGAGLPGRRLTYIARIRESFTLEESATTQRPSLAVVRCENQTAKAPKTPEEDSLEDANRRLVRNLLWRLRRLT